MGEEGKLEGAVSKTIELCSGRLGRTPVGITLDVKRPEHTSDLCLAFPQDMMTMLAFGEICKLVPSCGGFWNAGDDKFRKTARLVLIVEDE